MEKTGKKWLHRVDAQVSIFTACVVVASCLLIYIHGYIITYKDMINSLTERVYSIYYYLEKELDKSTFVDINSKEDMNKESYKEMKQLFYNIKRTTGVQYLYTAKQNSDGEFIYVIDGLDIDAGDFRNPGDMIEPEIAEELGRALKGELILPNKIMHTDWGNIFITYLPIHDGIGNVVGAIGIEFVAENQYNAYKMLRRTAPFIIIATCIICGLFALLFFKRISNPNFKDFSNTDYLTGLKNRNSYELDINNMCALERAQDTGLVLADLNGLKFVNDTFGHESGDLYIKLIANALSEAALEKAVVYRVGGDEFAVLIRDATTERLDSFIFCAQTIFSDTTKEKLPMASCSFGKAICQGNTKAHFDVAYKQADNDMYNSKKNHYASVEDRRTKNV